MGPLISARRVGRGPGAPAGADRHPARRAVDRRPVGGPPGALLARADARAIVNGALALAITEAGRRRRDARLLLIGLAFLVSAGFLGLHALATPGVLRRRRERRVRAGDAGRARAGRRLRGGLRGRVPARGVAADRAPRPRAARRWSCRAWGCGRSSRSPALPPLRKPLTPAEVELPLGGVAGVGVVALRLRGVRLLPGLRCARRAPLGARGRVRVRAARRGADRLDRLARDELAAELVGVARPDGRRLLLDRRRPPGGVVRGALQRPLPRRDAGRPSAR